MAKPTMYTYDIALHLREQFPDILTSDEKAIEVTRAVFDLATRMIVAGYPLVITRFGKFDTIMRPSRQYKDLHTGEVKKSKPKKAVHFKEGSAFKEAFRPKKGRPRQFHNYQF